MYNLLACCLIIYQTTRTKTKTKTKTTTLATVAVNHSPWGLTDLKDLRANKPPSEGRRTPAAPNGLTPTPS